MTCLRKGVENTELLNKILLNSISQSVLTLYSIDSHFYTSTKDNF